jgi:hypothetical protein
MSVMLHVNVQNDWHENIVPLNGNNRAKELVVSLVSDHTSTTNQSAGNYQRQQHEPTTNNDEREHWSAHY